MGVGLDRVDGGLLARVMVLTWWWDQACARQIAERFDAAQRKSSRGNLSQVAFTPQVDDHCPRSPNRLFGIVAATQYRPGNRERVFSQDLSQDGWGTYEIPSSEPLVRPPTSPPP
jgi:hypothetical protein